MLLKRSLGKGKKKLKWACVQWKKKITLIVSDLKLPYNAKKKKRKKKKEITDLYMQFSFS